MSDPAATPTLAREEAALAVALAWTTAATAGDEAAARAATAPSRWDRGEDQLADLYQQVARKGLIIEPLGIPHLCGARGAQHATLSRAGLGRPLGDLYLLLEDAGGAWALTGATKVRPQVALVLGGTIDASAGPDALPASEPALRWAALFLIEQALGATSAGATPPAELTEAATAGPGVALRAVRLPATQRHAVELRFGEGDQARAVWVLLEGPDDALVATDARRRLRWEALLRGLELRWPTDPSEVTSASAALGPDELRAFIRGTMQAAMDEALAEAGDLPAEDPRRTAPTEIMKLLDAALGAAPLGLDALVASLRSAPASAATPAPASTVAPSASTKPPPPENTAPDAGLAAAASAVAPTVALAPVAAAPPAPPVASPAPAAAAPTVEDDLRVRFSADAPAGEPAAAPEPTSSDPAAATPLRLPPKMQAAMGEVFAAHAASGETTINADFLAQHGGELAGGLLRGLLQEVLPPSIELDVTVPQPAPDGQSVQPTPMKVKVDLGSVLSGLFRPRPAASAAPAPATAPSAPAADEPSGS
ncbi:MAG: hypothetical protein JNM72_11025 [Deltaproteobacteria bacterium]|nr:hypothetical protein [Deltaproteobacteria bacterium]